MADAHHELGSLRYDVNTDDDGVHLWQIASPDEGPVHRITLPHEGQQFTATSWSAVGLDLTRGSTHLGYVQRGSVQLECDSGHFDLIAGMYFSVPGGARLSGSGSGLVTSQADFTGLFQLGGPIEATGRLLYIDGCSDTLLIPPAVRGEACLNLLHLPPNTRQTAHTHPSFRCGLVTSGVGICRTAHRELPLAAGSAFSIAAGSVHSFHTKQPPMRVIAFHPDSDFGPWHDDHPMVNRTLINGTAASQLPWAERRIGEAEAQTEANREVS